MVTGHSDAKRDCAARDEASAESLQYFVSSVYHNVQQILCKAHQKEPMKK